ncbi:MAG TPA: hypothetical protein VFD92_20915 [Candidatus Binatia bacterium]|nr:hypothetical protein [Candidatus Binatia bacterium]
MRRLAHTAAVLAIAAAAAAIYANSFGAGWVFDNAFLIRRATRVHDATWANVVEILTTDYWWPYNVQANYRPLTTLSFLFNWAVLGNADRPAGYHALNLALHVANALLLYAVLQRTLGARLGTAFRAALLFACHPVATEAVTNIVGRADLLAALAVLAGLLFYGEAVRAPTRRARASWLVLVAVTALAGLLSKESAVGLAGVVVLYDVLFDDFPAAADGWRATGARLVGAARTRWIALVPPVAVVFAVRWWIYRRTPPWVVGVELNALAGVGGWSSYGTAFAAFLRSLGVLVWPATLCPDYSLNEVPLVRWPPAATSDLLGIAGAATFAVAVALVVALRRRARLAAFLVGFFLVTWLPTSNLLFTSTILMAERLLYLPLAGFAGCAALAIDAGAAAVVALAQRQRPPRSARWRTAEAVASAAVLAVALAYGARAARRNLDWRSEVALWSAAVESCPASHRSYELLAAALLDPLNPGDPRVADIDRVIALQERAIDIVRRSGPSGAVPATLLERLGFLEYRKSRLLDDARAPGDDAARWSVRAAESLGAAAAGFLEERRLRRERYGDSADASPELAGPLLFDALGMALLRSGQPERATSAFAEAAVRAPVDPGIREHLATASYRAGAVDRATTSLLQAVALAPERADLASAVAGVYASAHPGECSFAVADGRLRAVPDCEGARRTACAAWADLERDVAHASASARTGVRSAASSDSLDRVRAAIDEWRCRELDRDPAG